MIISQETTIRIIIKLKELWSHHPTLLKLCVPIKGSHVVWSSWDEASEGKRKDEDVEDRLMTGGVIGAIAGCGMIPTHVDLKILVVGLMNHSELREESDCRIGVDPGESKGDLFWEKSDRPDVTRFGGDQGRGSRWSDEGHCQLHQARKKWSIFWEILMLNRWNTKS